MQMYENKNNPTERISTHCEICSTKIWRHLTCLIAFQFVHQSNPQGVIVSLLDTSNFIKLTGSHPIPLHSCREWSQNIRFF